MNPDDLASALAQPGRASIPYVDRYNPDRPLVLECFRAQSHDPEKPVVIVQHGASRNGAEYCGAWIPAAEQHGLLIIAITFSKEAWPDAVTYNNGHVLDEVGSLRPRDGWSLAIPGCIFALLREAGVTQRDKTYLWGHSAGGQFVHRLLATQPPGIFEAVGAANSGWYTLPTLELRYPDGLDGIGLTRDDVVRFLGYPLVIFSGDQDIDGTTENFPKHDAAMAQGPNRFARAQFYLDRRRAEAAKLGVPCRWSRVVVPGVAHEGMRMSASAAIIGLAPGADRSLACGRQTMTQMAERAVADRAPAAMVAGAIPLIDVAGHLAGDTEASRKAATQLRWAFENVGFYYLSGHGVPPSLIERTYEAAARFHAQPMAKKLALKVNEHNIGYLPISNAASPQAAAQGRKPSQNEAYFLRRERAADDPAVITNRRFHGLNQWPGDLPGFRARALEYMQTLEALCRRLVLLYALALDLPADFFDACFAKPHMILRMSRYPVIDGEDETVASLVPHTDSGFMTLLPPNPVPGLSILLPSGRWIEAPGVEGAYVVNGGDILHRWTNERFLSTPHRVRNLSGHARIPAGAA